MSDAQQGLPAAGSGQTQNASQPPAPAGQGEQQPGAAPQYLTREDALRLFEDQFQTRSQSIADRTAARVQQVINKASQQGIQLNPEQARAMLELTEAALQPSQATTQPSPAAQPKQEQPAAQQASTSPDADQTTEEGRQILQKEYGLDPDEVSQEDPEFKLLDLATNDPEQFKASVRAYGKAKQERLAQEGDAARLPGLASRGAPPSATPYRDMRGTDILNSYYRTKPT